MQRTWKRRVIDTLNRAGPLPFRLRSGPAAGTTIMAPYSRGRAYRSGTHERQVSEALSLHLQPGMIACDIGSYLGYFAVTMAQLVGPNGHVYAFEPLPRHVKALSNTKRLNRLSQLTVVPSAIGHFTGEAILDEWPNDSMNTLSPRESAPFIVQQVRVPVETLDHWANQTGLSRLDCIKLDIEGHELAALQGAAATIRRHRPIILCEIHRGQHVEYRPWEIVAWLDAAGYSVERIRREGSTAEPLVVSLDRLDAVEPQPGIMHVLHIMAKPQ